MVQVVAVQFGDSGCLSCLDMFESTQCADGLGVMLGKSVCLDIALCGGG